MKSSNPKALVFLSVSLLLTPMYGCKPKTPASEVKTLDNFVGAVRRQNKCMANPAKSFRPQDYPLAAKISFLGSSAAEMDVPLLSLVRNAIVNVPKPVQDLFNSLEGRIVVADDAATTCKDLALQLNPNAAKAKDLGEMSSCLVTIPATKAHNKILHAHFSSSIAEVHHNAMRVFGSFLTDVAPAARPAADRLLRNLMAEVAKNLVLDIAKSPVLDFNSLSYFLSASDIEKIKQRADSGASTKAEDFLKALDFGGKGSSIDQQFRKMAFIESFDSYYCNDWAPVPASLLDDVLAKRKPLSALGNVSNTRQVMVKLFPLTYQAFNTGIGPVLQALSQGSAALTSESSSEKSNDQSSGGLNLTGENSAPSFALGDSGYQSPAWAGTKAFFGSIWDSTGGNVGRGYTTYSNHVQRGIDKAIDSGSSVPGALVKGTIGGVADTYTKEIAAPIAERTDRVFQNQIQGNGGDINAAFRNTLAVELLRPTGATAIAETTMVGNRFDGSQYESGTERASEFFGGVGSLAGTAAAGVSMVPGLGNRIVGGGTAATRNGITATVEEASANSRLLQQIGVAEKNAGRYADAFEGGAQITNLPAGSTVYRTGKGAGSWVTRTPIKDAVNGLAIPATSEASGATVSKFVTTRPMQVLEGGVSPQPGWVTPGNPKLGGAGQMYIPRDQVLSGGMRAAADNAILGGTGAEVGADASLPKSE
jgi:hypothetical protein